MENIEKHQSNQHWKRVETILPALVVWNGTLQAVGVLNQTENNSDLFKVLARFLTCLF